eukprot:COSAG01_NODE_1558_length_9925_cov_6.973743_7_plen_108_part_00
MALGGLTGAIMARNGSLYMADTGVTWIYYHPSSPSEVSLSIAASAAAWRSKYSLRRRKLALRRHSIFPKHCLDDLHCPHRRISIQLSNLRSQCRQKHLFELNVSDIL